MSELQAIFERRRRYADAARESGGDVGGGDDESPAAVAPQPQHNSQSNIILPSTSIGGSDNTKRSRQVKSSLGVEEVPGRNNDTFVPTPPSQLPSRVHSLKSPSHNPVGNNDLMTRTKIEGSVAYRNPTPASTSSLTPQEELQKKLLERRMKFSRVTNETNQRQTAEKEETTAIESEETMMSSLPLHVGRIRYDNSATNTLQTETNTTRDKSSNNVKFEWNNRTKKLEPVIMQAGTTNNNNIHPPEDSFNSIIPKSSATSMAPTSQSSSSTRTGGFFKRTSPLTNSTTKPVYGVSNRQSPPPQPLPQSQSQSQSLPTHPPQAIEGQPSSYHSAQHNGDAEVRRTVAGRGVVAGGGMRGEKNRRGAPQSSPPMLSSMAAKYKEDIMQEQSKKEEDDEEEKEQRRDVDLRPESRINRHYSIEAMTSQRSKDEREFLSTRQASANEVGLSQSQIIHSTPSRMNNTTGGQRTILTATTVKTTSDDGSVSVPEFMKMRLRSTPNKRRSAMGVGDLTSCSTRRDDDDGNDGIKEDVEAAHQEEKVLCNIHKSVEQGDEQINSSYLYNNAVIAAKNAIDMSNRSKTRPWTNANSNRLPQSSSKQLETTSSLKDESRVLDRGFSYAKGSSNHHLSVNDATAELFATKDPSLVMESSPDPSPSTSLVMVEEDEDAPKMEPPHPFANQPQNTKTVNSKKETAGGGKRNAKEDRISQLANLLATDQYDKIVPTTPSAVLSTADETNFTVNLANDKERRHADEILPVAKSFFGTSFPDSSADASNRIVSHPAQDSIEYDVDIVQPGTDGSVDNAFASDPFVTSDDFGSKMSEKQEVSQFPNNTSVLADNVLADNDNNIDVSYPEAIVSFEDEVSANVDEDVEFRVDAPDFTDDTIGASAEDVVLVKQPVLTNNMYSNENLPLTGMNHQDNTPAVASFRVKALKFASVTESIRNPLSGNMIACRRRYPQVNCREFVIEEVELSNHNLCSSRSATTPPSLVVMGRISAHEIETKLKSASSANDIKVVGVSSIHSLAAGVHRVKGHARVRVAVLADIFVLSRGVNKVNNNGGMIKMTRIVAVWRWAYSTSGSKLATLQSVLTLDSIDTNGMRCNYDPKTLQVADGLLFLGGCIEGRDADSVQLASTAAVFIAKPSVRNFWTTVPLENTNSASVSTIAVSNDKHPYLAAGLSDGSVLVLTYGLVARTNRLSVHKKSASILQALYYMHGEEIIKRLGDEDLLWSDNGYDSIEDRRESNLSPAFFENKFDIILEGPEERGCCTSIAWIDHNSSGMSSLPLLAAAFTSGIAIYHIPIPSKQITGSVPSAIAPLAQAKFSSSGEEKIGCVNAQATSSLPAEFRPKISWCDLGPRSPLCVTVLVEYRRFPSQDEITSLRSGSKCTRLGLCAIDIPWYGSIEMMTGIKDAQSNHRSIGVIALKDFVDIDFEAGSIVSSAANGIILCHSTRILICEPNDLVEGEMIGSPFPSLLFPVASATLGLDSDGSIYSGCTKSPTTQEYRDVTLSVYSIATCGNTSISPLANGGDISLTIPSLRHWLLISNPGDDGIEEVHHASDEIDRANEVTKAGASSDILFELTCGESPVAGLVPSRISKENCGRCVGVMFTPGFFRSNGGRTHTKVSNIAVAYTILDIEDGIQFRGSSSFKLRHGRDVAFFLPSKSDNGFYCSTFVVLEADGSAISLVSMVSSGDSLEGGNERAIESEKCSLQYEGVEGYRVFTLLNGNQPQILIAGFCKMTRLHCLIRTTHTLERCTTSNQLMLLKSVGMGNRLWLRRGESIVSALELPKHRKDAPANVAVASQKRVMIVSFNLTIIAEIDVQLTCASLSPLGSHCVAFCVTSHSSCQGAPCVMYLSCLEGVGSHGIMANIANQQHGRGPVLLTAIRPDRFAYLNSHSGLRVVDEGDDDNMFVVPLHITRPMFLLEPLLANALCQDGSRGKNASMNSDVQLSLRMVIEKFGRKDKSYPHADNQGIGISGVGITSQVFKILEQYNCIHAASFLATGRLPDESGSLSTLIPPWVPIQSKLLAVPRKEITMQAWSCGDDYKFDLLPRSLDFSSVFTEELAYDMLKEHHIFEAATLLDRAGRESSESILIQLALSLRSSKLLERIGGLSEDTNKTIDNCAKLCAAIGYQLMQEGKCESLLNMEPSTIPVSQLAPSFQLSREFERFRDSIIPKDNIASLAQQMDTIQITDSAWSQLLTKNMHVWSAGPFGNKELLLELNDFGDWLGRHMPIVLGKEGVATAATTGEQALADILSAAARDEEDDSNAKNAELRSDSGKFWAQSIGEGRTDEDNLSLYFRFSEGADEDDNWKTCGFTDLTKYAHVARLYGYDTATVEATTSSVDEGEEGKVKLLYDLVFPEGAPREKATGLVLDVPRGGSLDIGMLHDAQHSSRKRCTIELWYHLPQAYVMTDEIILVRRSLLDGESDDVSKFCVPDEKHNILWEVAVLPNGLLELRTGAGSVISSTAYVDEEDDGLVSWEREDGGGGWNHLCLIFSSLSHSNPTDCSATILMNGTLIVQGVTLTVNPLSGPENIVTQAEIEEAMQKTVLIFGIGPCLQFRMTDLRVWACERSEDDIKIMMYEYLRDAELKKKLKVQIRKGAKKLAEQYIQPIPLRQLDSKKGFALAPPPRSQGRALMDTERAGYQEELKTEFFPNFADFSNSYDDKDIPTSNIKTADRDPQADHILNEEDQTPSPSPLVIGQVSELNVEERNKMETFDVPSFEVTYSKLLSANIRKSAASAIVRGPPAARHFGGNRGGLLSEHVHFGSKCDGVSPVAICGADKSVVWFSDRDPPGKTYPIGASGAVLSDVMDEDQSEYMCCFLAKEKKMVVFELSRKLILIELQMKTKLNFWRYLPPEAHGSELAFVLITPIGGFHWKPLDKLPRPCQVWKRGPELESKKILTYEEGGSNGLTGANTRSAVALVTVSPVMPESTSIEAYCISLYSGSSVVCISSVVLGAALYCPSSFATSPCHFLPYVVTISKDVTSQTILDVESLLEKSGELIRGSIIASTALDFSDVDMDELYEPPSMAMGHTPEVLCCCHNGFIVIAIRRRGLVFTYDFSDGSFHLVGRNKVGNYIVDAAIRSRDQEDTNVAELVLLLSTDVVSVDGQVATIHVRRI